MTEDEIVRRLELQFGTVKRASELFQKYRDPTKYSANTFAKPGPGETVMVYPLGRDDGIQIRLYDCKAGDALKSYCLDFIDKNGVYIKKPEDLKIIKNPKGDGVSAEFFTYEDAIANDPASYKDYQILHPGPRDPNFETYIVREGYVIDVKQDGKKTICIHVPMRPGGTASVTPIVMKL